MRPPAHRSWRPRTRVWAAVSAGSVALLAAIMAMGTVGGPIAAGAVSSPPSADQVVRPPPSASATVVDVVPAELSPLSVVMAASRPVRLRIPAIGVDTPLMALGLLADGSLEVPPLGFPAGWFTGAPTPGELGPAVIAGHVDWAGREGVFYRLRDIVPGDEITVGREDGSVAVFRVARTEIYPKDEFPTDRVFGDIDHAGLRLITCTGSFDRAARSYVDNIVVFADLIPDRVR